MADAVNTDYFRSKLHEDRMKKEMDRQQAHVLAAANEDGALAAISISIAALTVHATALRALGMAKVVRNVLENKPAKKGR